MAKKKSRPKKTPKDACEKCDKKLSRKLFKESRFIQLLRQELAPPAPPAPRIWPPDRFSLSTSSLDPIAEDVGKAMSDLTKRVFITTSTVGGGPEHVVTNIIGKLVDATGWPDDPHGKVPVPRDWRDHSKTYRRYEVTQVLKLLLYFINAAGGGGGPRELPPQKPT